MLFDTNNNELCFAQTQAKGLSPNPTALLLNPFNFSSFHLRHASFYPFVLCQNHYIDFNKTRPEHFATPQATAKGTYKLTNRVGVGYGSTNTEEL